MDFFQRTAQEPAEDVLFLLQVGRVYALVHVGHLGQVIDGLDIVRREAGVEELLPPEAGVGKQILDVTS